jgi:hypothetical protein
MTALGQVLQTYMESGHVLDEQVRQLAADIGGTYERRTYPRLVLHLVRRGDHVVFAGSNERQATRYERPDPIPCATCGSTPIGTFHDGSPRYDCGPHFAVYSEPEYGSWDAVERADVPVARRRR